MIRICFDPNLNTCIGPTVVQITFSEHCTVRYSKRANRNN